MNIDGRYHEATPSWLCIHKSWMSKNHTPQPVKKKPKKSAKMGRKFRPVIVSCDGEIVHFDNRKDMADKLKLSVKYIPQLLDSMEKSPCGYVKSKGKIYKLIKR